MARSLLCTDSELRGMTTFNKMKNSQCGVGLDQRCIFNVSQQQLRESGRVESTLSNILDRLAPIQANNSPKAMPKRKQYRSTDLQLLVLCYNLLIFSSHQVSRYSGKSSLYDKLDSKDGSL